MESGASITNRIQEMIEEIIPSIEDTVQDIDTTVKDWKIFPNPNHQGNLGHNEKNKENNMNRREWRFPIKIPEYIFNKIIEENFANQKKMKAINMETFYRTSDRLD